MLLQKISNENLECDLIHFFKNERGNNLLLMSAVFNRDSIRQIVALVLPD